MYLTSRKRWPLEKGRKKKMSKTKWGEASDIHMRRYLRPLWVLKNCSYDFVESWSYLLSHR